jgi:GNAT superfamily N-acetyltransferase
MHAQEGEKFGVDWHERVRLRNGQHVTLRLLRPEDREMYLTAFAKLSATARYHRFFEPKDHLTPAEVHYLVDLDQVHHFAIVATHGHDPAEGVGLARCVQIPGQPTVAEPAVTVLDGWQGLGIGRLLMRRLVDAARVRGVERFHVDILAGNSPMLSLLDEVGVELLPAREHGVLTVDLPLPDALPNEPHDVARQRSALERLLRLAAKGIVRVLPRLTRGHH